MTLLSVRREVGEFRKRYKWMALELKAQWERALGVRVDDLARQGPAPRQSKPERTSRSRVEDQPPDQAGRDPGRPDLDAMRRAVGDFLEAAGLQSV